MDAMVGSINFIENGTQIVDINIQRIGSNYAEPSRNLEGESSWLFSRSGCAATGDELISYSSS